MPDTKITALAAITTVDPAADVLPIVDISDTSMAASGTTKKITSNQILGAGGTATLASATITGALTGQSSASFYTGTALPLHIRNSGTSFTQIGDNGTIGAGTAFIVGSSDASLRFQCGGAEQMRLNSTGLGVGISSPFADAGYKSIDLRGTTGGEVVLGSSSVREATITADGTNGLILNTVNSTPLRFYTQGGEKMRIDVAGQVGIGITPSAWSGTGVKVLDVGAAGSFAGSAADVGVVGNAYYNGSSWIYKTSFFSGRYAYALGTGQHQWFTAPSGTAGNAITFTQAMTLDSGGNLFVGKTATGLGTVGIQASPSGWFQATVSGDASLFTNRLASDGKTIQLYRQTLEVGNISVTTTGATFNSTSDYRLKEAVAPLSGGLARVNALKPSVYKWKSNGLSGEGFLAHELAEVVPAAVNGEKDDVNEDGSIKAQSIDMSRVVPILVAAIQELAAEVNALKNA